MSGERWFPGGCGSVGVGGDWRVRAACRGEDPELFFPVGDGPAAVAQVVEAKAVCARCPVVGPCLEFALVAIPEGVVGGLSARERRVVARDRRCRAGGVTGRFPAGVDRWVVASLVGGERVAGASVAELAFAAVQLYLAGHKTGWIAASLGVSDERVYRWLKRHREGDPPVALNRRSSRVSV